jgi:hypothetical protein
VASPTNERPSRPEIVAGCLAGLAGLLGAILFLVGLIGVIVVDPSPYKVAFSEPGDECVLDQREREEADELILDRETGEPLTCGVVPQKSTFSERERTRLLDLSRALAEDRGLDAADQAKIRALVDEISAEHGYTEDDSTAHRVFVTLLVAGVCLVVVCFVLVKMLE